MNIVELKSLARTLVPAAGKAGNTKGPVTDANLLIILSNGALEIAKKTKCLPTYSTFDTVADQDEYNLNTLIGDYLCPLDDTYLYYYQSDEYVEIDVVSQGYLNLNHAGWINNDSNDPERAFISGDILTAHPAPNTAVTDGFLLYHAAKPTTMDVSTYIYPFGGTVEISRLTPYHTLILDYWVKEAFAILDLNEPNSPRLSRAETKYLQNLGMMADEIKKDVNQMMLKSRKTRLRMKKRSNPF